METLKTIAQIIYYFALSIAGPLAVIAYLKAKKSERLEKEYQTYDELDNRFFEYQKLALEYYDLDILDVPNNDPSLSFDKSASRKWWPTPSCFRYLKGHFSCSVIRRTISEKGNGRDGSAFLTTSYAAKASGQHGS